MLCTCSLTHYMMTTLSDGVAPLIIIIGPAVPGINDNECWHNVFFLM